MTDRNDDELDPATAEALRGYRRPPPVPTESLWSAIEAADEASEHRGWVARSRRVLAVAASLVVFAAGVGVGYAAGRESADAGDAAIDRTADMIRMDAADSVVRVTWF